MNWLPTTIPINQQHTAWRPSTPQELIANEATAAGNWFGANGYPPLRWQIDLCNSLGARIWLSLPHYFTPEQNAIVIRHVAGRAKYGVIVEYSNEVWNSGFSAFHEMGGDALKAMLISAEMTIAMSKLCKDLDNVKFVFGAWAGSVWHAEQVLEQTDIASHVTALAVAPYFGMEATTLADAANDVDAAIERAAAHVALAKSHGIECWCYEQGPHVEGENSAEINRSAQMGALMRRYDRGLASAGVTVRNWYSAATAFGSRAFGLYETVNQLPVVTAKVMAARNGE